MRESNMQTFWRKHIENNPPSESEVWELKFTKTRSIRFDALQSHQREALLKAKYGGLFHKLTDPPVFGNMATRFNAKRPFDCFFIKQIPAHVLVWFYVPRQQKCFIKIDIDEFLKMEQHSVRMSFTEDMALQFGQKVCLDLK